jgi:transcriptional regulator with XRE-family HTH domain
MITQHDLVARLQIQGQRIDQGTLSKIENGTRPVYDYEVAAFVEVLQVPAEWLLGLPVRQESSMNGIAVRDTKTGVEYPSRSAAAHALRAAFGLKQDMNWYEIVRLAEPGRFVDLGSGRESTPQ